LDNAVKYGKPDSPIHVVLSEQGSQVRLEVYDHGPGLPEDQFELVFQPFYRTDTARARSKGGTGLGLAIVRQIVEVHGGTIQLRNHPQTGGLWVQVELPRKHWIPCEAYPKTLASVACSRSLAENRLRFPFFRAVHLRGDPLELG